MTRRLLTLLAVLSLVVISALPAGATSCAAVPGVTPRKILAGKVQKEPGAEAFFERYAMAVVGTVGRIDTIERQGAANYGATRTMVTVAAAFGVQSVPPVVAVASSDPGWMNGYAFEVGRTYFIPLQAAGPEGQPNYSFLCDPIFELDGPADAEGLVNVAQEAGVTVAAIDAPAAGAAAAGGGSSGTARMVALGAGVAGLAGLGFVLTGRR